MQVKSYAHGPDSSDSLVIDLAMFISSQNGKRDTEIYWVRSSRLPSFCRIAEIILWSFTFTAAKARWSLVWQILEVHKLRNRHWKQGFCSQHQIKATMTMHPATKQLPKWPSWQGEDPESVLSSSFREVFARLSQNLAAKKSNLQAFKPKKDYEWLANKTKFWVFAASSSWYLPGLFLRAAGFYFGGDGLV